MKADRQQTKIQHPFSFDLNRFVLLVLLGLTLLRIAAVAISPLELGVDEAQYWLWSQSPDFGYFTNRHSSPGSLARHIGRLAIALWRFGFRPVGCNLQPH